MTEKGKMQKQMLYDANNDRDLLDERAKVKDLCYQFNQLRPSDEEGQWELMKQLLGQTKETFCVIASFWCDYGYNIEIGENFFANHNTVILDGAKVKFGDNVFIAPDLVFTQLVIRLILSVEIRDQDCRGQEKFHSENKLGFMQDLIGGIKKITNQNEKTTKVEMVTKVVDTNITPLLIRVSIFLQDKEWDLANEYCERVLDMDPENGNAYF